MIKQISGVTLIVGSLFWLLPVDIAITLITSLAVVVGILMLCGVFSKN